MEAALHVGIGGAAGRPGTAIAAAQRAAVRRFYRLGLPIWCGGARGAFATVTFDDGPS